MKRVIGLLSLAVAIVGCTDASKTKPDAQATNQGRPAIDESSQCIAAYLGQCGWRDVEVVGVAECTQMPAGADVAGEAWAFVFSAKYSNVFGELQSSDNWVAVIARTDGKPAVRCCFDHTRRLVGGHRGDERAVAANLTPMPPADELPSIVPPKP